MVTIKKGPFTAKWDGQQWASADPSLAGLLNAVRHAAKSYLPMAVNVQSMVTEAFGNSRYETISADLEPFDPGAIH